MKYTVDRIEEEIAVLQCEDGVFINVSLSLLPEDIRDGSILQLVNGCYTKDFSAEEKRRAEMYAKQQRLLKKNKNN